MALVGFAMVVLAATEAGAQENASTAEALFSEGRKLAEQGRWSAACDKFKASLAFEPDALGTKLNLARCYAEDGRLASAWIESRDTMAAARRKGDATRAAAAGQLLEQLRGRVPKLVIRVTPQSDMGRLSVLRDGTVIAAEAWGIELPVDPGTHALAVTSPGKVPWSLVVVLAAGEVREAVVPVIADVSRGEQADETRRNIGLAALVAGGVSVGVGATFALVSKTSWDIARGHCRGLPSCDPAADSAGRDASRQEVVALVASVAGAVLVGTGVVLLLSSRHSPSNPIRLAPSLALGGGGLLLSRCFE